MSKLAVSTAASLPNCRSHWPARSVRAKLTDAWAQAETAALYTITAHEALPSTATQRHERAAGKANNLQFPAERAARVGRTAGDSPAAKAGLQENDFIPEVGGQRVEGAAQFSRMVH